jgi:16S rRNA A1518/A1519 N6-dimethyltransferase RsmA/KsgA/DIM1 with predicted DNA glycosylase/AP lyase activity
MNPFTDWQTAMNQLENKSQMTILELGVGGGTQYLIDNFKKVISIEYSRYEFPFQTNALNHTYLEIKSKPETILKDDILISSNGQETVDVVAEVEMYYEEIKKYKPDMVFVDFGFHFRGAVVQKLIDDEFSKYIAYHDTNFPYYQYDRLNLKSYRIKIHSTTGQGTIILENVKKDL